MRVVTERFKAKDLPQELRRGIPDDAEVRVTVQTSDSGKEASQAFSALANRVSSRVEETNLSDPDIQKILDEAGIKFATQHF